ncbi:MAG: response regulator [Bacteroidetes bacterium]|nr:response regulator [Bacteroidota bacterium]
MNEFVANNRVLYVDDEEPLLAAFSSLLRREHVEVTTLHAPQEIETVLQREGPFAMVFSDLRMPGMDGVAVLEHVAKTHPHTMRVLVTGFADHESTIRAINDGGIQRYISKPWEDRTLRELVREGVRAHNLESHNTHLLEELKTRNEAMKELLQGTLAGSTRILSDLVGHVNPEAAAQVDRIRRAGKTVLAMLPNVGSLERWEALRAFDLFNLGIAALPAWILVGLTKHGLSSIERFPHATTHNLLASDMLKEIPRFEGVARIIRLQQKDYDGSGPPAEDVVAGVEIPLGARILHVLIDLDRQSTRHFRGRAVLEQMARHPEKYDVSIIRTLLEGKSASQPSAMSTVHSLDELQTGALLLNDIVTEDGQILLRKGMILSDGALVMIRQWARHDTVVLPIQVQLEQQTPTVPS